MKIAVSGSSGLLGSNLCHLLTSQGHELFRLVRKQTADPADVLWHPESSWIDAERLQGCEAFIHLSGESIHGLWTQRKKSIMVSSRLQSTALLCETIAKLTPRPGMLLCASATGYYGRRGEEMLTEESPAGKGFMADLCARWEAACRPARDSGIQVTHMRLAVVLTKEGGMLKTLLPFFRWGLGGPLGDGRQWLSWIALQDAIHAMAFLLKKPLPGPVNLASPNPITNRDFTSCLGRLLRRPTLLRAPEWALRAVLTELADQVLLSSARVQPVRLLENGFVFQYPHCREALQEILHSK